MRIEGVLLTNEREALAFQTAAAVAGTVLTRHLTRVEVLKGEEAARTYADGVDLGGQNFNDPTAIRDTFVNATFVDDSLRAGRRRDADAAMQNGGSVLRISMRGLTFGSTCRRGGDLMRSANKILGR